MAGYVSLGAPNKGFVCRSVSVWTCFSSLHHAGWKEGTVCPFPDALPQGEGSVAPCSAGAILNWCGALLCQGHTLWSAQQNHHFSKPPYAAASGV